MKTSIAETREGLIEATSRRNADAAQMQAIEIFLAGSDSRDEMLRLFELHEIVPHAVMEPTFVLGVPVRPGEMAAVLNDQEGGIDLTSGSGAAIASALEETTPAIDFDDEDMRRFHEWANEAEAADARNPVIDLGEDERQVIVVENFLGDLEPVQACFKKIVAFLPLMRDLVRLNKEAQSNLPGNCGLELSRDIRRDIVVRKYANIPETRAFCEGWLRKRQAIAKRDPEQIEVVSLASVLHPQGWTDSWKSSLAERCPYWHDRIQSTLCALNCYDESDFDLAQETDEAFGLGGRGEGKRIRPDKQLAWLMAFKTELRHNPSLFHGLNAIQWYLSVEDMIPELATVALYFLCRTNSSADIERRISHLRWVLGTYRHGMNPRTLELLMIMQDDHDLTDRIHLTEAAYALLQQQKSISAC
jgi:hypothetical protein